jgi:hypothetical protein
MNDSIIDLFKPKNRRYRHLEDINLFLNMQLGVKIIYKWEFNKSIRENYIDDIYKLYVNNIVFVYFPNDNIRIDMSINNANKITPIKAVLENNFSEKALKIKYYNSKLKKVMDGPIIVIINLPLESIFIDNITLLSKFYK